MIITADHGEAFWEHGKAEHGNSFFDEVIRVPLIFLHSSGGDSHIISQAVSIVDLFPTVLSIAGIQLPKGLPGLNLQPYFNGKSMPDRILFSENPHSVDIQGTAYISPQWKFISLPTLKQGWLYDVAKDPNERRNLILRHADLVPEFKEKLRAHRARNEQFRKILGKSEIELDEETDQRLKALGYVNH